MFYDELFYCIILNNIYIKEKNIIYINPFFSFIYTHTLSKKILLIIHIYE